MSTRDGYTNGTFSWVDLMSPDIGASKEFYGNLFGWQSEDQETDDHGLVYTILRSGGKMVAGLGGQSPEMKEAGAPAVWNSYVQVADVDATQARVEELGGSVMMPAMQVMEAGRMAIFSAPDGSVFSAWEPGVHIGAELVNEPYALGWNELATDDPQGAMKFYGALFGWTYADGGMEGYQQIVNGRNLNGGILPKQPDMAEMPNSWAVYFNVEDCDATVARTRELGGSCLVEPMELPQVGRFAVLADPQGGVFTAIKTAGPEFVELPEPE